MAGKVFISCGQRPGTERDTAAKVAQILRDEFGLCPYLAFKIQGLEDIMTITKELRSSDYYLFIDFQRKTKSEIELSCSLFTHQELALAHHLGFQEMIALQQEGAPWGGFIKYVLSNPEHFTSEEDLIQKIRELVKQRQWNPSYSRNLVISNEGFTPPISYADHTGSTIQRVYQVKVENKRPDVAAVGAICILDYIINKSDGNKIIPPDRSYLKWAGQHGYERTILPNDDGLIDAFAVRTDMPGLFLHSLRDTPREPIIFDASGEYELYYKLFSQGFPLVEFAVKVKINWSPPTTMQWSENTTAELINV
jgi:hypothetical protein